MAPKDVMGSATIGFDAENTEEVGVSKASDHSTITPVNRIQDERENGNRWIATRGLVRRVLGIGSVPGYIWQHLGFATARISETRQTGEDANISLPSSNLEFPDTDVSWERN